MYKRVILKLSGEALAGETDKAFENETINGFILQIKEIIQKRSSDINVPHNSFFLYLLVFIPIIQKNIQICLQKILILHLPARIFFIRSRNQAGQISPLSIIIGNCIMELKIFHPKII